MCGIFAFQGSSLDTPQLQQAFASLQHRGPDQSSLVQEDGLFLGFHRLAIRDLSERGLQPFVHPQSGDLVLCNGEIFNEADLKAALLNKYSYQSQSDCEVLLALIAERGFARAIASLDAEFALIYFDRKQAKLCAARDPIGIRPLFYGYTSCAGEIVFASEAKALHPLCQEVFPFPPGYLYDGDQWISYRAPAETKIRWDIGPDKAKTLIRDRLTVAVHKRLHSDRPLACLLSGGLDSSLIVALAQQALPHRLATFAVGLEVNPIDLKYAREVAAYLGTEHHEVIFNTRDAIDGLEPLIAHLATWDVTTIRASIGMWIVCAAIKKQSPYRVLLTGEVSDELFGYKYTDFAPSAEAFQAEAQKRVRELYAYDVLRADRCISGHGLEARVPFADLDFVEAVMSIPAELKLNRSGLGKALLRQAFAGSKLLPDSILYREKAAFSDAVGHGMVDAIKAYAEHAISNQEWQEMIKDPRMQAIPTKEACLYLKIFKKYYPKREDLIPGYWMPNPQWKGCEVSDPSARALANYGASGV